MDSNRYPEDKTFASRLRQIFFEVARREEALQSYEAAMTYGALDPTFVTTAVPMSSVVKPIDSYKRRQAAVS